MEADLHRYYQRDVVDVWRGKLTFRKLGVLIRQLPPESALSRKLLGGREPWSLTDYLLSDLWALQAKSVSKKAPDQHPWRAKEDQARKASQVNRRSSARMEKLKARQQAHRRRKVAGR
ncbi:hypothetical protein [Gordonia iterans]